MAMDLLKSLSEWDHYRQVFAFKNKLDAANVLWGKGPAAYPCLVVSAYINDRVLSCYVYVDDALALVKAADLLPEPQSRGKQINADSLKEYARKTSANILAILSVLLANGLVQQDEYETLLAGKLAEVDRKEMEDRSGPTIEA